MNKGDQKGPNKIRSKPAARTSKPRNELKTERPKQKAVPGSNQSETAAALLSTTENEQSRKIEHPKSEIEYPKSEIKNPQSEIPHPKSEIKTMEVHHHPQLDHKPKPIKEYLLEGFMIFIAVMMGFIAENIRETINNNEHVRQLTSQLAQDLKADTGQLNAQYLGETKIVRDNKMLKDDAVELLRYVTRQYHLENE